MKKTSNTIDLSIIIPTYNEKSNIGNLLKEIKKSLEDQEITYECLVMDDNSPDGTYGVVKKQFALDKSIRPVLRKEDKGLARSILEGITKASGKNILVMDSDFNHDPKNIWQMYCFLDFYDVIIGSRFVYAGGMEDTVRNKFSYLFNLFIRLLLGTHIQDNLSGFFVVKRKIIAPYCNEEIFNGYGEYFIRLLYRMKMDNYSMLEIPVYYNLRKHGKSKSNFLKMIITYTLVIFSELDRVIKKNKSITSVINR